MPIRPYRPDDARALAELSRHCARGETDFVLNPYWESEGELAAEFERFGISPEEHLLVADAGNDGQVQGLVGFLRNPGERDAGMFCPIVAQDERGRGVGGELLRAALQLGKKLGLETVTAGIGTRNRGGFSLLTSHGFRPVRQTWLMKCERRPEVPEGGLASGLTLEQAAAEDAADILELYLACEFPARHEAAMQSALGDGRHAHAVARHDGKLVGFVELETHWPERPWVAFVGVVPELRDRGVGSLLVAHALARAFDDGARSGQLMLSPANRSALRTYEKVGFKRFRLVDVLERRV